MHRMQIEKNWDRLKGRVRSKWNRLTDEDMNQISGKYDLLVSKIQKRYGHSREQVEREIRDWMHRGEEKGSSWRDESCDTCRPETKQPWERDQDWKKKRKAG